MAKVFLSSPLGEFDINSKFVSAVSGFPFGADKYPHYKFRVSIKSPISPYRTVSFNYYGSYNDYTEGKTTLDGQDLIYAFDSFLGDAIAGLSDYMEFVSEFGYDWEDKNAKKIWGAVQQSTDKAFQLGLTENDLYELGNWLREKYEL